MILAVVTAAMIFLYGAIEYTVAPYAGWDLASYRTMASSSPTIAKDVGKPFAYRWLGPYLAGLLPLADVAAFRLITVIASFCLVFLFYSFLRSTGIAGWISVITATFLTFNKYWFGFTSWDFFQVNDVLALCFIVVMLWSMLAERWIVFGAALALGAATKEPCMLMVPVLLVYLFERKASSKTWGKASVSILPALAVFVAIRVFTPVTKGIGPLGAFLAYSGKVASPERLLRLLVNSFLPWSFVPLVFAGRTIEFFKTRKYAAALVVLVFLSALFGANDERLMAPSFVVVYLLIATILQEINPGGWVFAVLIGCAFASSFHHVTARYPLPNRGLTEFLSLGSLAVVTAVALLLRRERYGIVLRRGAGSRGKGTT